MENFVIVLASGSEKQAQVVIAVDEQLVKSKGFDASKFIKDTVADLISGKGGGQKTLATAKGIDSTRLSEVINYKTYEL